ncbi:MAG: S8 family serine peptidase, partial [Candidatus Obscuribacterales bacterium]|nr:S8 family serine peptidase [Candidatus Obscuribacterales bacterium]
MNNRRLLAGFSSLLIVASTMMPLRAFAEGTEPPSAPVVLDQAALAEAANLTVNAGQTAVIDFGSLANGVNLTGDLINNGTIYAYSTNAAVTTGQFFANNITNTSLITSIIPQSHLEGLGINLSSLVSNFGLSFSAINNIVNSGTISSAGNLAMQAGGSITNSGILSAIQNINMTAASIMNSGTIAAQQNNGVGIAGVANNVKIMAIRTVPDDADELDSNIVESFLYAANNGAKIIN